MTAVATRYRVVRTPGPGLAIVDGPLGTGLLWSRVRKGNVLAPCANCDRYTGKFYRPPEQYRLPGSPRLCAACVEGTAPEGPTGAELQQEEDAARFMRDTLT